MQAVTRRHVARVFWFTLAVVGCREEPAPRVVPPTQPAAAPCAAPAASPAPPPAAEPPTAIDEEPFATDPENRQKPDVASDELNERARHLFDAIATGEPTRGDDFFFPRAPFLPLKDVRDPGRYFDQLLATYHRDIRELHSSRRNWDGVRFVSFALGTTPTWVPPGREYNKIGYFRTFHGTLRWQGDRSSGTTDVGTIISYHGRWYVTHLAPIRK
jgi:hypothetical protein